jgi:ribosome biogenesis protein Tsr3
MKQPAAFKHLLAHFRYQKEFTKGFLNTAYKVTISQHQAELVFAKIIGALECLYWQALGNGLINLAKGIHRYIHKLKAHVKVDYL